MTKKFEAGVLVRSVDNPGRRGVVTNAPAREKPSGMSWPVRWFDGPTDYVHEDELELDEPTDDSIALVSTGRYGRAADLRRNLTYVHLAGRLANLVYAMGITSTDFYAHQYRPLLTLLESPASGLLIADEVGLGKTIEAGLIWTELRARFEMRRLLVVCPAMLREKWRDELRNRFGVDGELVDAERLLDALQQPRHQTGEGKAWIISYQAARPPRNWRRNARKAPDSPSHRWKLAQFLHESAADGSLIDLVVFDEAHYMRNRETASWRIGDLLREVSEYRLMLSATPINLHNQDLFSLLNLIDPDHFQSEHEFEQLLNANRPLVAARDAMLDRTADPGTVLAALTQAAEQPMLAGSRQLAGLLEAPPTAEQLADLKYRATVAGALERLNLLSHVVTRTRKRDVQERRVLRNVRREAVAMTDAERELYAWVTKATRAFAQARGISTGFLLATPQRQVTSCPAAIAAAWMKGGADVEELWADLEAELEVLEDLEDLDQSLSLRELLAAILPSKVDLRRLREQDSKFQRLLEVARDFFSKHPDEKIVLFTTFRTTARYLVDRLNQEGMSATLLWGGQQENKQDVINRFKSSTADRFLVSTEVAAEGVDLQFCRVLVNYDLPWNPTRIEQRIGRIDRLGQNAPLIHIWNLVFEGTIDDRIVSRLMERLQIFQETLGEAEAVVGELIQKLESALLSRPLTPDEEQRQIDQTAQALENLKLQREDLEKNAAHMMAHGQRVLERVEAAQELARRVTQDDLFVFVRDYLSSYWQGHRFAQDPQDPERVEIQLPADLAARFDEFLRLEGLAGKTSLGTGTARMCRFLNKISEVSKRKEEIIHQLHPLIRYISRDLQARNEHFYPLVAVKVDGEVGSMPLGQYAFCARRWSFKGVKDEEILAISAASLDDGRVLNEDEADVLVQTARLRGRDWIDPKTQLAAEAVRTALDAAEADLDARYRTLLQSKKDENADRAHFQLESVQQYLDRRMPRLQETLHRQIAANHPMAKATQGQIDKLRARMEQRRERIKEQEKIASDKDLVCMGVIAVGD